MSATPLTSWVGRPLRLGAGRRAWVRDLVVDLAASPAEVTAVVVGDFSSRRRVDWSAVVGDPTPGRPEEESETEDGGTVRSPSEVLLVRDVLDSRVYDVGRRRTARVGEVWLDDRDGRLFVLGLDVRLGAAVERLRRSDRRGRTPPVGGLLDLSSVHLTSRHGHRAQLRSSTAPVHRLRGVDLAHLLTHLPVDSAADVARHLPTPHVQVALGHLHPHVRDRVQRALQSDGAPARTVRTRRTDGWRLYRPREHRETR